MPGERWERNPTTARAPDAMDAKGQPIYTPPPAPQGQMTAPHPEASPPAAPGPASNTIAKLLSGTGAFLSRHQAVLLALALGFMAGSAWQGRKQRKNAARRKRDASPAAE